MGISFERIESNTNSPQRELTSVEKEWATDEFWTTPKWLTTKGNYSQLNDYESYLRYHLQVRYLENQEDFRTAYNNFATTKGFDTVTASRIVELLKTAKFALEENTTNLLNVANLLDLAQRFIIWLFPYHVVSSKINILLQQIPNSNQEYSLLLTERLKLYDNYAHLGELRATYDEIVGALNKITIQNHISYGLQIKRLQILRYWGFIVLIFCLIILPFSLNIKETGYLSSINTVILPSTKTTFKPEFANWIVSFLFALIGGLGGFISGLFQIKNTSVDLLEFRESILKFQIKPILGAISSLIVAIMLSWKLLPGLKIESIGTFFLISFLIGFSERYFLTLLKIDIEEKNNISNHNIAPIITNTSLLKEQIIEEERTR